MRYLRAKRGAQIIVVSGLAFDYVLGFAFARALPDTQAVLSREEAFAETRRIVDAVSLPVSADSENCYADEPEGVAADVSDFRRRFGTVRFTVA